MTPFTRMIDTGTAMCRNDMILGCRSSKGRVSLTFSM